MQNAMILQRPEKCHILVYVLNTRCSSEKWRRGEELAMGGFGAGAVSFFLLLGAVSAFSLSFLRSATSS